MPSISAFALAPAIGARASPCSATSSFRGKKVFIARSQARSRLRMNVQVPQEVAVVSSPPAQKPPPAAFNAAVGLGQTKAGHPAWKVLLLGIAAGAYIAIGALLALTVGGAVPGLKEANPGLAKFVFGSFGLPFGLTMVVTTGAELFTGNTMLITASTLSGRTGVFSLMKNWIASFIGNFIGSLLVVKLALATGCLGGASAATAIGIATAKVGMDFWKAFARGVACNWLVCMAIYMSNAASDFTGKFLAIWLPISAFVAMGFDHSIANMFLVPMGKALGASVGWKAFLMGNLLPVTLGNIVGGAGLVALVYYLAYGKK